MNWMNPNKCRVEILAAVREMASAYPQADYCTAREAFGLLGKIKRITGQPMPTAKQCWERVGLTRSHLVDEFTFSQDDVRNKNIARSQGQ